MIKEAFLTCALALSQPAGWHPPLTDADVAFHDLIARMTPSRNGLIFVNKPWAWSKVMVTLRELEPGGFVMVQGRLWEFDKWFKDRGWLAANFMWRDYHVYKKPMNPGLYLVKKEA